jgi:hypothetical protein
MKRRSWSKRQRFLEEDTLVSALPYPKRRHLEEVESLSQSRHPGLLVRALRLPGADTPRSPNPAKDVGEVGRGDAGGIHRVQNGPVTSPPSAPARSSVIKAAGGGIRVQQQSRTANVTLQ